MHSLARFRHRTGLGNNTTPIKWELEKNTTPTNRGPSEPNAIPGSPGGPPVKTAKPRLFITRRFQLHPKKEEGSKHELHCTGVAIYKEAGALEKSHIRFLFSTDRPILHKSALKTPVSFQEVEVKSATLNNSILKSSTAQLRPSSPGASSA